MTQTCPHAAETTPGAGRKLAVLLPGIGYTCDRPLLYYGGRLARSLGFEVLPVPYGGFPPKVRGDRALLLRCAELALAQTETLLREVDWSACASVLFLSKSIGTVAAAAYAHRHGLTCRHVLFTPLEETFYFPLAPAETIAFHGTADPWAQTDRITALCTEARVPLVTVPEANHSLETGDVERDIRCLAGVMERVWAFLTEEETG